MRPFGVVSVPPVSDQDHGLGQVPELGEREQLVAHAGVVRLDERVLPGRARLDVARVRPFAGAPVPERPGDHLGAVVAAQVLGRPAVGYESFQDLDQILGGAVTPDAAGERFAGELVHDVGDLDHPSVRGRIELEVDRPHVVGTARAVNLLTWWWTPALAVPGLHLQTLLAPDA